MLRSVVKSGACGPCQGNCLAIRRAVVYNGRAAHLVQELNAGAVEGSTFQRCINRSLFYINVKCLLEATNYIIH